MKKIALEEHFTTRSFLDYLRGRSGYPRIETGPDGSERLMRSPTHPLPHLQELLDLGPARLAHMDAAGIDTQVLSMSGPGVEEFDHPDGADLARRCNDELAAAIRKHPDRFAGLATFAYADPESAAAELERSVKELGLKGGKVNSHVRGEYLDERKYWVLFETAQNLGVPIYLHPKEPTEGILKAMAPYPELMRAMWGYSVDGGLHAMRLIMSGLFDAFPRLQIILGHLGEGIPFWLWRIDNRWAQSSRKSLRRAPGHYFRENFYVTTSGMFGTQAFLCVHQTLGPERILFAVDYPYESSEEGARFVESLPIRDADKEKICHSNAETLLAL
jgi:predicted TIM-barrel fold metal-dependent hydrolase